MATISIQDARTQLKDIINRNLNGEEIIITRNGIPTVRLEPAISTTTPFPSRAQQRSEQKTCSLTGTEIIRTERDER